jgi:hypothetical protein
MAALTPDGAGLGRQLNIKLTLYYLSVCLQLSIAYLVGIVLVCGLGPCYFSVYQGAKRPFQK